MGGKQEDFEKNSHFGTRNMKELLEAIKKTNDGVKMKRRKLKPKDLFEDFINSPLNTSKDVLMKIKTTHKNKVRSSDISKWTSHDFISYMRDKTQSNRIRFDAYEKREIAHLQDRLTKTLETYTNDKSSKCDNVLLKNYLDWWISVHKERFSTDPSTVEYFCNEKSVRRFFSSGAWKPVETPHVVTQIAKRLSPSSETFSDLYRAGGAAKLIYDAGVVDTLDFLVSNQSKTSEQAIREIRKALTNLHPAVFEHVMDKTVRKAPYPVRKQCDVYAIIKNIVAKRKLTEFNEERFSQLFEKEN